MQKTQFIQTTEELRKKRRKKWRRRIRRIVLLVLLIAVLRKPAVSGRLRQLLRRLPEIIAKQDSQALPAGTESDMPERPQRTEKAEINEELLAIMRDAVLDFEDSFTFRTNITDSKTSDELFETVYAAYDEMRHRNPELFWISGMQPFVTLIGENKELAETAQVNLIYLDAFPDMKPKKMYREMQDAAKQILDAAPKTGSDYDKALFVHDYLVAHTSYDLQGSLQDSFQLCHTAYGALVNHSAVCMGYTAAYQYLLRELGVYCRSASGMVKDSARSSLAKEYPQLDGSHAWNCVELDGEYYWVDVTWDDPLDQNGQDLGGPVRHDFCFVDDAKIFESRTLDDECTDLPVCSSMKLNEQLMKADAGS